MLHTTQKDLYTAPSPFGYGERNDTQRNQNKKATA